MLYLDQTFLDIDLMIEFFGNFRICDPLVLDLILYLSSYYYSIYVLAGANCRTYLRTCKRSAKQLFNTKDLSKQPAAKHIYIETPDLLCSSIY